MVLDIVFRSGANDLSRLAMIAMTSKITEKARVRERPVPPSSMKIGEKSGQRGGGQKEVGEGVQVFDGPETKICTGNEQKEN